MKPVVITLPASLANGTEILVRDDADTGPSVDVRGGPRMAWVPIAHVGGSFTVRPA